MRDLPSRFRPPHETPYIEKMRNLLNMSEWTDGADFMNHVANIRRHIAVATDDDLNDVVRLSVQRAPGKYTETFEEILYELKVRRESCRSEI